jgi:hypothetical protein
MPTKNETMFSLIEEKAKEFRQNNDGILTPVFYSEETKYAVKADFYMAETTFIRIYRASWGGETSTEQFEQIYANEIRHHRSIYPITIPRSLSLEKSLSTWLDDQRQNKMKWNDDNYFFTYRNRYFEYLKRNGRSEKVLKETKRSSLSIVKKLGDPESQDPFYVRGMVVGSVQSGKTTNFNAVINSAIDCGYRLIIVLSGIMEDLRSQTQKRIDNDVVGRMLTPGRWLGVGSVVPFKTNPAPGVESVPVFKSITSTTQTFNMVVAQTEHSIDGNNIMVCNKNVSVLSNILLWLKGFTSPQHPKIDYPLLLIDDEADNASLNNKGYDPELDPTKINLIIRAILDLCSRKTYLGYTATPFANILHDRNVSGDKVYKCSQTLGDQQIHHEFPIAENFFPDNFIELLFPPSDYIGIKHFFETKHSNIKKLDHFLIAPVIDENELLESFPPRFIRADNTPTTSRDTQTTRAPKLTDPYPINLPVSLNESIQCFILSIAVRLKREPVMQHSNLYQPHHSMLVHVSRFTTWQNRTKKLVTDYLRELRIGLDRGYNSPTFDEFRFNWNKYYLYPVHNMNSYLKTDENKIGDPYLGPLDFDSDIRPLLHTAIRDINVMAVNSATGDNLFYPSIGEQGFEPKKYIAIGGNRLSRGFTLEGLTVNYFLRPTEAADTLIQMARWFGYRPGYLDCCKLFTTQDIIDKFDEASLIIEDLEIKFEQLSKMVNPTRTPGDFTLWIRNNPDVIKLTRPPYLKYLQRKKIDFSSVIEQSTRFRINRDEILAAWEDFKNHVKEVGNWHKPDHFRGFLSYETDQRGLLSFLSLRNTMDNLNIIGLKEYLESCKASGKVTRWIVAIKATGKGRPLPSKDSRLPVDINLTVRSGPGDSPSKKRDRDDLLNNNLFRARNATIINPTDFAITLSPQQLETAESDFRREKKQKLINEGIKEAEAEKISNESTIPDYVYREAMDDSTGLLIVYLMDLNEVLNSNTQDMILFKENLNLNNELVPLIGCAIGFPTIRGVKTVYEVAQNVFKEPQDMTINELLLFAVKHQIFIDDSIKNNKDEILKRIFKIEDFEPKADKKEMTLEQLKEYVVQKGLPVNLDLPWRREDLLREISDAEENEREGD